MGVRYKNARVLPQAADPHHNSDDQDIYEFDVDVDDLHINIDDVIIDD